MQSLYHGQRYRRVDMTFGVAYDDDLGMVERTLREIVEAHPQVLAEPEPMVEVKEGLEAAGCSIPFPQRDVHVHESTA